MDLTRLIDQELGEKLKEGCHILIEYCTRLVENGDEPYKRGLYDESIKAVASFIFIGSYVDRIERIAKKRGK